MASVTVVITGIALLLPPSAAKQPASIEVINSTKARVSKNDQRHAIPEHISYIKVAKSSLCCGSTRKPNLRFSDCAGDEWLLFLLRDNEQLRIVRSIGEGSGVTFVHAPPKTDIDDVCNLKELAGGTTTLAVAKGHHIEFEVSDGEFSTGNENSYTWTFPKGSNNHIGMPQQILLEVDTGHGVLDIVGDKSLGDLHVSPGSKKVELGSGTLEDAVNICSKTPLPDRRRKETAKKGAGVNATQDEIAKLGWSGRGDPDFVANAFFGDDSPIDFHFELYAELFSQYPSPPPVPIIDGVRHMGGSNCPPMQYHDVPRSSPSPTKCRR